MSTSEQTNTVFLIRKLCDQIQQQLLSQQITEDKQRSTEKTIQIVKDIFIKIVSSKLTTLMTIQQKYASEIKILQDEVECQRQKAKDLYLKYEAQILQNDKMKMETVEVSQAYENAVKSYEEMKQIFLQTKQKNKELQHKVSISHQNQHTQTSYFNEQFEIKRQFYEEAIKENQKEIEELRESERIASERILHLEGENQNYMILIKGEKERSQELTMQNIQLITKQKEFSHLIEKEREKLNDLEETMKKLYTINRENEKIIQDKVEQIQLFVEELKIKDERLETFKIKIHEAQELAVQYQKQGQYYKQEAEKYQLQSLKLKEVYKRMGELEEKYNQKEEILNKYLKEQKEKNKTLKAQINRLYQAMDQYASKEIRYTKKAQQFEKQKSFCANQLTHQKQKIRKIKEKMVKLVQKMKKLQSQAIIDLKTIVNEELERIFMNFNQFERSVMSKINCSWEEMKISKSQYDYLIKNNEKESKQLYKQCIEAENNLNKITQTLFETKDQMEKERQEKDQLIMRQKNQIQQLRLHRNAESERIANMVEKYTRKASVSENMSQMILSEGEKYPVKEPAYCSPNININKELQIQKVRFSALQKEYQTLLKDS